MKAKTILFTCIFAVIMLFTSKQKAFPQQADSLITLRLKGSFAHLPGNKFGYYSMEQADAWSDNFFELGFLGVDALNRWLFKPNKSKASNFLYTSSNYLTGFAFAKFGSSLPVPLGEWSHEEYHRSVLGTINIQSKNGMWLFHRWDGTVYGVSDEELTKAKANHLPNLLYAYVSGLHSEISSTRRNVIADFYTPRKAAKNPLYLYNAWYVWNYFRFSTSAASDSARDIASRNEDSDPRQRDFAGADLTAWIYDMFRPEEPFTDRASFPGGNGVNRRIGFSDLPEEGRSYLLKQRKLSLLNFLNPAIFLVNDISLGTKFSFNALVQYAPTHFGNSISLLVPFRVGKNLKLLAGFHRFSNYQHAFPGLEFEINDLKLSSSANVYISAGVNAWQQPENQGFFDSKAKTGGSVKIKVETKILNRVRFFLSGSLKTSGWEPGIPYLDKKGIFNTGFIYIY
jgi:hypothetical protein